jgi:hypothetical protein
MCTQLHFARRFAAPVMVAALASAAMAQPAARSQDRKAFPLENAKADAVFKLLAPNHVQVLVSRTPDGIAVQGTSTEVDAVARFVELITRDAGKNYSTDQAALAELRKGWDTQQSYKLPEESAEALFAVLAFDDVPVLVAHAPDGISIEAGKRDQKVIARMVRILNGKRLTPPPSKTDTPQQPAPPARAKRQARKKDGAGEKIKAVAKPRKRAQPRRRALDALEKRLAKLEHRVKQLEQQVRKHHDAGAPRDGQHARPHGEDHHADHHHNGHGPHGHGHPGMHKHAHRHGDHAGEAKKPAKKKRQKQARKRGPAELIDRRYKLPPHHADHLYSLFAPADIHDVIVSRDGNTIKVRASERDHKTIERLVDILNRGQQPPE